MKQYASVCRRAAALLAVLAVWTSSATAQLVSLKTVPVAAGDQFFLFPSQNAGMGGVSIALDDPMLDPFVNPAKGGYLLESQVFTAPTYYNVSNNAGSAGTLSVGTLFGGRVFGGGMVSLQQINRGDQFFGPVFFRESWLPPDALRLKSATNKYGTVLLGARLPGDVTIGA